MAKREAPLDYLARFIPSPAVPRMLQYLNHYQVHLTITRERKTVLGDYRHAHGHQTHRISVNSTLNAYAFLITLIHEMAHLVTFMEFGHRVAPHGKEWKQIYARLLADFLELNVFPADIESSIRQSMHNLPASSCSDEDLMRVLKRYDRSNNDLEMVEQLPEGSVFQLEDGRRFRKGKKLRKRYQCVELATGKLYLFSPVYEVKKEA